MVQCKLNLTVKNYSLITKFIVTKTKNVMIKNSGVLKKRNVLNVTEINIWIFQMKNNV